MNERDLGGLISSVQVRSCLDELDEMWQSSELHAPEQD